MNTKLRKRQLKHVLGFKKIPVKTQAKPQAKEERLHLPHKIDNAACKKKKRTSSKATTETTTIRKVSKH